jgi:hypothetical protein
MKHLATLVYSLVFCLSTFSQSYWQQEVNYKITVRLDDNEHKLRAYEEFEYVNNSPDQLDRLYIHLWPNAYKNGKTALGKQQYKNGETELAFGDDKDKGSIDSLDFRVNGIPVKWEFDREHIDIAILYLSAPLKPGERLKVSTPFTVKIPSGSISRLGHIGQSYQITQWYPKPAVYDKNGWNQIPYLNQGEFYSEVGSFDVTITLPKNYVVGATGDLQTEEELDFLNAKASETLKRRSDYLLQKQGRNGKTDFPPSDAEFKTIRYTQDRVHDFAWFADKRYAVSRGEVILPHSKRSVTTWAMWVPHNTNLWQHADEYLRDGTYYYSLWNGDYPYNNVTAVDGTISAGGGMEYPTITVIGNSSSKEELEVVIVHEVGHNWFYGILGSNERVHGWMDEGMNTLNEVRYMQTKYPDNTRMSDMVMNGSFHMDDLDHHDLGDISYRTIAHLGEDQPIETHSADFAPVNYGVIMYQKTGLVFFYLKDYLGEELFDKCMHTYFDEWKFKHPQPEDMRATLERVSGKDLSWIFEDLIQTTNHVDYKLKKVKSADTKTSVTVKNVGQVDGPIEVNLIKNGEVYASKWTEPGSKRSTLDFETTTKPDQVSIDITRDIPEMYRNNNNWKANGMFKRMEPLKMEFLIGDNEQTSTNLFWTPVIAGNFYDKVMLGAAFHNNGIPFNKFQYLVAPMYSFGRQMVSGIAEFSYTTLPRNTFKTSRLGLSLKSFKDDSSYVRKSDGAYLSIAPFWAAKLGNRKSAGPFSHDVLLQGIIKYDIVGGLQHQYNGGFVRYNMDLNFPDHQLNVKLRNDYIQTAEIEMSRILLESTYKFRYMKKNMKRWVELRGFIGNTYLFDLPDNNTAVYQYPFAMSLSGSDGQQDLFFEEYYFGRNSISGIWSQQRNEDMGGFKSTSYSYGITTNWMATTNLYVQLPIPKLGIFGAFVDFGAFSNGVSVNTAINTGLAVRFGKIFGLYFPVWMSKELNDSFGNSRYAEKIRFTLKFNPINKSLKLGSLLN